jgi:cell division protein ZapB
VWRIPFCFPFNCAEMNIGTGTNSEDCKQLLCPTLQSTTPLQRCTMSKIEELADRVERLLLRHEELQRTAVLLEQQVASVSHERDSLRSRLNAARSRIDALLERLPQDGSAPTTADTDNAPAGTAP